MTGARTAIVGVASGVVFAVVFMGLLYVTLVADYVVSQWVAVGSHVDGGLGLPTFVIAWSLPALWLIGSIPALIVAARLGSRWVAVDARWSMLLAGAAGAALIFWPMLLYASVWATEFK